MSSPNPSPAPERLKKRRDFVRLSASGAKFITPSFIVLAAERDDDAPARVGFTVTRKLGGAVTRNRIRRRLREGVRLLGPEITRSGWDYVLIARNNALLCGFPELLRDLRFAFRRVGRPKPPPKPPATDQ